MFRSWDRHEALNESRRIADRASMRDDLGLLGSLFGRFRLSYRDTPQARRFAVQNRDLLGETREPSSGSVLDGPDVPQGRILGEGWPWGG